MAKSHIQQGKSKKEYTIDGARNAGDMIALCLQQGWLKPEDLDLLWKKVLKKIGIK